MQTLLAGSARMATLLQRDDGIAAIEYAMIAAAIALVVLGAAPDIGNIIDLYLSDITTDVQPAP